MNYDAATIGPNSGERLHGTDIHGSYPVFLLPRHATSADELIGLGKILVKDGRFSPVVVMANRYAATLTDACQAAGLASIDVWKRIAEGHAMRGGMVHFALARLEAWCQRNDRVGHILPLSLLRLVHQRHLLQSEREVFDDLVNSYAPVAILVPGDRELSPVPAMLRVGLDRDVPTIVATSTVPDTSGVALMRKGAKGFRAQLKDRAPLLNWIVAKLYPAQVNATAHGVLLFSPGWRVLAMRSLGMLIDRPWVQGGGNSRYIFHVNQARLKRAVGLGLSLNKCVAVGDYTLDPVYESYGRRAEVRRALAERYGFSRERRLAIVAVPQDAEHDLCDWNTHRARMRAFLGKLARPDIVTLLVLHPKSKPDDYRFLVEEFGFDLVTERLFEVLPAADIFVCANSTTLIWARLCGLSAINLDYLHIDLHDAKGTDAVKAVDTPDGLAAAIDEVLLQLSANRMDIAAQAEQLRTETLFDGQAGQRIVAFLLRLAQGERPVGPLLENAAWVSALAT